MLKPTKILVPTDFSEYSDIALQQALDIANDYGAEVHVLHVVEEKIGSALEDGDYTDYSITPTTVKRFHNKLLRSAKVKLERQIKKVSQTTDVKIIPVVLLGLPYDEIIRYQQDNGLDLVVISSVGHTGLSKFILGSVARNVLKGTTCPVLLSKSNGDE